MKIRTILFTIALAAVVLFVHPLGALAQEPTEAAYVRGHFSQDSNVWSAKDFGWFYYDIDDDQGGEQLRIDIQGRLAEKGHIIYSSKTWSKQFEYEPWGSYDVVALFGKPYLAGYPDSSLTDEISSLEKGDLRSILLDEDKTYTLTTNASLPLQDRYVLRVLEVSEKNGAVNFALYKNENPVYAAAVGIGDTFVYKVDNIPVLLFHLVNAMMGNDTGFAEIDAIFQVGDEPSIKLIEGAKIGNMELNDFSLNGIEFQNDKSLSFIRDSVQPLMDNLAIIVLDQPDLIYYPMGGIFEYGIHEIRGPTFDARTHIPVVLGNYNSSLIAKWDSENYSAFRFDPEKLLGIEALVLYRIHGKTVFPPTYPIIYKENNTLVQEGFQYTSLSQPKEFEFGPWGYYYVINFLGMQWFAGYGSRLDGNTTSKSLIEREYLGRVLIDAEMQDILLAGNYSLDEGYEMRIRDVGNDSFFMQLFKEGDMVDSSVVKSNSTYIYKKDIDDVDDVPVIVVHFGNVFYGEQRFATIDGVFQISDQYIPIEPGSGIGEMEIVLVMPDRIIMVNHDYINLNRDSTVNIGPGMNIRVADNDTFRYFLYATQYVVPEPKPPLIDIPSNVTSHETMNFTMVVQAAEIANVMADIQDSSKRTVFSKDIAMLGRGSGDLWSFSWNWNATTLQLSDDNSPIMDADGGPVPGLLQFSPSEPAVQVAVRFDPSGRIAGISNSKSIYYISREEYKRLNVSMDYDTMMANETARRDFIKIEPGKSVLQFLDVIDGRLFPSNINHTIEGTYSSLEPHAKVISASPGSYELSVRIENAAGTKVFGGQFNVTPGEIRGISLGSEQVFSGEDVSVPLVVPSSRGEKRISISYDPSALKPKSISGACQSLPSWQIDSKRGIVSIALPDGCSFANLTFIPRKTNATTYLNVTGTIGFKPETTINGTIAIMSSDKSDKKSNAPGLLAAIVALAFGAYARRKPQG